MNIHVYWQTNSHRVPHLLNTKKQHCNLYAVLSLKHPSLHADDTLATTPITDMPIKWKSGPHTSQFEQNWRIQLLSFPTITCYAADKVAISAVSSKQISPLSTYQALARKYSSAVICKISLISSSACCPSKYPCLLLLTN